MDLRMVFTLMLVLTLSGEAVSQNDPLTPDPQTETILLAATQQVKPVPPAVFPKTGIPRTPAVPKSPTAPKTPGVTTPPSGTAVQMNPSLVAARQMEDTAKQMAFQARRYQQEMAKLKQDPTMMGNPAVRSRVNQIEGNGDSTRAQRLLGDTQSLLQAVLQVLNASGTQ